jgi:hypothetical protein
MGWKLAVVIARLEGRALGPFVDEIYDAPQTLAPCDVSTSQALYPDKLSERYALAHDGFGWVFDWKLTERALTAPVPINRPVWSFILHSVVNAYGFAAQADAKFVRCRTGDSDGGVTVDVGTPSPAERTLVAACGKPGQEALAWSTWTDASKSFDGVYEDTTHDGMGEEIVFGLMNDLLGFRLDRDSPAADEFVNARVMRIERPKGKSLFGWFSR